MRTLIVAAALALVILAGVKTAAPNAATTARGQTLFGMNAPSLDALDEAESALGARAAIVGTFADWAHAPDFPREHGWRRQRARRRRAHLLGAVGLVAGRLRPAGVRARPDRRRRPRCADRPLGRPGGRVPSTGDAAPRPGDERRLAALVDRCQRKPPGRLRRRLAACACTVPARGADNAIWVWNPIASYDGSTPLRELFPGSRQVDWMAVDGYNWGATRSWGWQSYADIFAPTVREFGALAPRPPVMIAETGSAPDRRKARWVTDTLRLPAPTASTRSSGSSTPRRPTGVCPRARTRARAARAVLTGRGWRQGGDLAVIERAVG